MNKKRGGLRLETEGVGVKKGREGMYIVCNYVI